MGVGSKGMRLVRARTPPRVHGGPVGAGRGLVAERDARHEPERLAERATALTGVGLDRGGGAGRIGPMSGSARRPAGSSPHLAAGDRQARTRRGRGVIEAG